MLRYCVLCTQIRTCNTLSLLMKNRRYMHNIVIHVYIKFFSEELEKKSALIKVNRTITCYTKSRIHQTHASIQTDLSTLYYGTYVSCISAFVVWGIHIRSSMFVRWIFVKRIYRFHLDNRFNLLVCAFLFLCYRWFLCFFCPHGISIS